MDSGTAKTSAVVADPKIVRLMPFARFHGSTVLSRKNGYPRKS